MEDVVPCTSQTPDAAKKDVSCTSRASHVAVLAFPFGSHAAPLLGLTQSIAAASRKVRFSFFSTAKSNDSIFCQVKKEDFPNIKPYNVDDGSPEGFVPSGNPVEPVSFWLKAVPENYKVALQKVVEETGMKVTCFLTDALLWFAADMAEEIDAKWVTLWTAGPHSVLVHLATDFLREKLGCEKVQGNQKLDFLPGFTDVKVADLPEGIVTGNLEDPFATMVHKMGIMLPKATAVSINSFEEVSITILDELRERLRMVLNVGPFPLTTPQQFIPDDHGCLQWLDNHESASVVFISFGTIVTPQPNELIALTEALEESKFPFLWSFRGNPENQLPEQFLERTKDRGKFVSWAPQVQILNHKSVGVFVTHCGWNSVLESIIGGVPMICRPFFGDQMLNMRMMDTVWQIGVGIENGIFTKKATVKALKLIMSSAEGRKMRQNIGVLEAFAMKAIEQEGSSIRNFKVLIEVVTR